MMDKKRQEKVDRMVCVHARKHTKETQLEIDNKFVCYAVTAGECQCTVLLRHCIHAGKMMMAMYVQEEKKNRRRTNYKFRPKAISFLHECTLT